jgi:hypothetical protein
MFFHDVLHEQQQSLNTQSVRNPCERIPIKKALMLKSAQLQECKSADPMC